MYIPKSRRGPDETGKRYNMITVLGHAQKSGSWVCQCDCGTIFEKPGCKLRNGVAKSCGCLRGKCHKTHGQTVGKKPTRTYNSWQSMIARCTKPHLKTWADYGGRGITFCERWKSFENFFDDMGERPEGMTLDRKDVNGNYEPGNCKWSTYKEQSNNKRPKGSK